MTRPATVIAVVGTATDVGKTWVSARLLQAVRTRGSTVGVAKPAQSFAADDPSPTDAEVLAGASGIDAATICPPHRWYEVPMAPPMAAEALGRPSPTLAELVAEIAWTSADVFLVESVGGVRSPVASDGDSRDLARAIDADLVILVADAGLGAIDAVRSAVDQLAPLPVVVFLNRFDETDELHHRNLLWLTAVDGFDVAVDVVDVVARIS